MVDLYQLLGVQRFAQLDDIQRAFSRLYSELFVSENPLLNIPKLKEIKEAFDLLNDTQKRSEYDAQLKQFLVELEKQYEKAVDALEEGNYQVCITILKECIRQNPKEADLYETLGLAYQLSHNLEEALKIFQQGLSLKVKPAMFHWYLGDLYRALLDDDRADTHFLDAAEGFKEILKIDPKNIEIHEMLADTYNRMKWYDEALEGYEKLLAQYPYRGDYHREIGTILYELDRLDEAEEHLQEAIRNAPEDSSAFLFVGLVYFKKRLLCLAIEYLEESLKKRAEQPEVKKLISKIKEIQVEVGRTVEEIVHDPHPDAMVEGIVKWFNAETGIGVLTCPEYPEVLLHYTALGSEDQETITKGTAVRFGVVIDKVGPIAVQVERIDPNDATDTVPGIVQKFDSSRRIGVIKTSDGREILFSFSALQKEMEEKLAPEMEVLFEIKTTKGLSDYPIEQATNIRPRKKSKK